MLTLDEIKVLAADLESDQVERTMSTTDKDKFREVICAFANDLPGHKTSGYLLIGVGDRGELAGVEATDGFLSSLGGLRDDGQIQPMPSLVVYKVSLPDPRRSLVIVETLPSDAPPVRARGRVCIRVGPRRGFATTEEERRLSERRVHGALTFDQRPCMNATLADIVLSEFETNYLPNAFAAEVLAENRRSTKDKLTSLRFVDPRQDVPTNAAVLLFGLDPLSFVPGAYVQFARYDGVDLTSPVTDSKQLTGSLTTQLRQLDELMPLQIRVAREPAEGLRFEDVPDYPLVAIRELVLNAVMHRSYEATNAPTRINWFRDRVEIQSPGGLYGHVTPENFGRVADYRNPLLSEAMRVLGYVEKFGTGIARARGALARNLNPEATFEMQPTHFAVTVPARS